MNYISIYSLSNPADGIVRYIGRTKAKLGTRLVQHCSEARVLRHKNKRTCWIKSVMETGVRPEIQEIDLVPENQVSFFERHYIKLFKSFGANLVNDTEGGEGVKGRKMTEENKKQISRSLKGRVFSEEHRKRLGESNTRRCLNGYKHSEKAKENIKKGAHKKPILMFDLDWNFIKKFEGIRIASRELNIYSSEIMQCLKGKSSRAKQFKFKYE